MKKIIKKLIYLVSPKLYINIVFHKLIGINWRNAKDKEIENEMLLLSYFLKSSNDLFIDVGANLGKYIYLASKCIKYENIYAFEPHNELYNDLTKLFKKVNLFNSALSDKEGTIEFKIPIFNGKEIHTRGKLDTSFIETEETDSKVFLVTVNKLDNYLNQFNNKKVKLIKIDVEGAEFDVLQGAAELIKTHKPFLIVEIEQRHSKTPILEKINAFNYFHNYASYFIDTSKNRIVSTNEINDILDIQNLENHAKNKLYINNFIFVPNDLNSIQIIDLINNDIAKNLSS